MFAFIAVFVIAIVTLGQPDGPSDEEKDTRANLLEFGEEADVETPPWANVRYPLNTLNTVSGTWSSQGPGPSINGQSENAGPVDSVTGLNRNEVTGAAHAVIAHPTNADILYVGGTNGGVWKTTNATTASPTWTPLTDDMPSNSIGALAFDPTDTTYNTVWAGIGNFSSYSRAGGLRTGLLRTTDAGSNWSVVNGGGSLNGKNISGLVVRGDTILAAVNSSDSYSLADMGLFRSTNGGNSFTRVSVGNGAGATGLPGGLSYDIASNRNAPTVIYIVMNYASFEGGTNGIYRSDDTGASWSKVSTAEMDALIISGGGSGTSNVEIAVGNGGSVFVAIINSGQLRNGGIFYSATGNAGSFTKMDTVLVNEAGGSVGTNPRFKPNDGEPGGQGGVHFSIAVDPSNDQVVYIGGDRQPAGYQDLGGWPNSIGARDYSGRLFRGNAGIAATGAVPSPQWEHLTHTQGAGGMTGGGTASNSSPHADSREMAFDANGNLIETDDGGIYRRTSPGDNTGDWVSIIGTLQTTEQHDVAYDPISNVIMSGNQDTGSTQQSGTSSTEWVSILTADGGDIAIGLNPNNPNQSVRYSSFQNLGGFRRQVYDSANQLVADGFPSRTVLGGAEAMAPNFVNPVEINAIETNRLIFGASNGIYESVDEGATISKRTSGTISSSLGGNLMVYGGRRNNIDNPDFIFAALAWTEADPNADKKVIIRTSAGGSFTEYLTPADTSLRGVTADPEDWNRLFVIDRNQVFMSTDAGANWIDITGDLPDGFTTTDLRVLDFVRAGDRGALLVGGINGVYAALDDTNYASWAKLGTDLPIVPVWDLDYDATDNVLVAGTLGRGSWKMINVSQSLFNIGAPEYTVTSSAGAGGSISPSGSQTVEASGTLTFTLTPNAGYEIDNVSGTCPYGGFLVSPANTYETGAISGNCSVVANFQSVNGSVPEPPTLALAGVTNSSVALEITANGQGSSPIESYTTSCEIQSAGGDLWNDPQSSSRVFSLGEKTDVEGAKRDASGNSIGMGRVYRPTPELRSAQFGDLLSFMAPNGSVLMANVTSVRDTDRGNRILRAETDDLKITAVVNSEGHFFSSIQMPGQQYQSMIFEGRTLMFDGNAAELATNPFMDDEVIPENLPSGQNVASNAGSELSANPTVVTVGVLYDSATAAAYDELALLDYYIDVANQSYQSSGVDIVFEVVAAGQFDPYLSQSDMGLTLDDISCGGPGCSLGSTENTAVINWRDTYKADMLTQIVRYGTTGGTCGIAWRPSNGSYFTDASILKLLTYSVSAVELPSGLTCPGIVMAHELGHNFGLGHDRATGCSGTYLSYACGYKVDGVFGTVMSYVPSNYYLANLSNPDLSYQGYPIGVPLGQSGEAFAALAVAQVDGYHEAIYTNSTTTYYTVTPDAGAGGSISPSTPQQVQSGSTTNFTITPNSGYEISSVTGCSGSLSGSTYTTGAITQNCTVVANFSPVSSGYSVTYTITGLGSVSPGSPQTVSAGGTASFTLTPSSNYAIGAVGGTCPSGSVSGSTYTTGAINANCSIEFSFDQFKWEQTSASTSVTFTGLPSDTAFQCVSVATNSVGDSDPSTAVNFTTGGSSVFYTVTPIVVTAGGSVSPSTAQSVAQGSTLTFTALPDQGYEFLGVDGSCPFGDFPTANTYTTGVITASCDVEFRFTQDTSTPLAPTLNSMTPGNGSLTVSFSPNSSGPTADSYTATCVPAQSLETTADVMMAVEDHSEWHRSDAFKTGGHRCGANEIQARHQLLGLTPPAASTADCSLYNTTISGEYDPLGSGAYVIPVYWHVISTSGGTGNVTDANINAQMAVLNEDYAAIFDTTVRFELIGITRTVNDGWFTDSPSDEAAYKSALGIDPSRYLNIYTNDASGYLGYATFPAESAGNVYDGVVMNWAYVGGRNLPGAAPYDLGRTLVHEVGHYLGLWHTFQGNGGQCANTFTSGDYIVDTWPHNEPDFGTSGTSVCGGVSDIENFMNYSDDAAMDRFTSQQSNRMICSLINYRPQLYSIESVGYSATGSGSPLTVTGLTNGEAYSCSVVANNGENSSVASNALTGTPRQPTLPGTPTISQSEVDDGEIYLYVTGDNGGLPILEYQASCTDGANTYTGSSGSSPVTVSGLTNGVSYQCQVRMRNSLGWSGYSSYSAGIVPEEATSGLPIWLLYQATQN